MTKKIFYILFFVTILGLLGCAYSTKKEVSIPIIEKDTYIYDNGNMLSDNTEKEINSLLTKLESGTGAEMVVITITDLSGLTIEEYANQLFNSLEIGKKEEDNGVLLLISRDDARVRLEIGIGFEDVLTDSTCGAILDKYFVPFRNSNDYDAAVKFTSQEVCKRIAEAYGFSMDEISNKNATSDKKTGSSDETIVAFLVFFILFAIVILAAIYFDDSNGSGPGFYGGYFGNSSGNSGSFGGGSSDGGGASR